MYSMNPFFFFQLQLEWFRDQQHHQPRGRARSSGLHQGWAAGPDDYIFTCSRSCGSKLLYLFDRIFVSLPYLHLPIVQRPYLRPYLHLPIVQRRIFRRIFVSSEDTAHETCSRTLPGHRRHYSQTSNLITIPLHVTLLYPCATPLQSLKTKNPNCKKSISDISKQ